jgi:hypothetical protein
MLEGYDWETGCDDVDVIETERLVCTRGDMKLEAGSSMPDTLGFGLLEEILGSACKLLCAPGKMVRVEKSKAIVESIVLLSPSAGELVDGIGNTVILPCCIIDDLTSRERAPLVSWMRLLDCNPDIGDVDDKG